MQKIVNNIKKISHNPITHIIMVDLLFVMFCAAILYVISETVLPGIVTQILQPYSVFGIVFLFYIFTNIVNKKHLRTYRYTKIPLTIMIGSAVVFCMILAIANYRFGTFLNGIMTFLSFCTAFAILLTLDATRNR